MLETPQRIYIGASLVLHRPDEPFPWDRLVEPGLSSTAPWVVSSGSEKKNIEDFSRPSSKLPTRGPTGNG